MGVMNKRMNLPALQKIMREFEMQNEKMEMTTETMGDAIDDAFEGNDEEEETENLVNQVLDEIGISTEHEVKSSNHERPFPFLFSCLPSLHIKCQQKHKRLEICNMPKA